jgi:hypothetical protein
MHKPFLNVSLILTLLMLVGCSTLASKKNWPADLPDRKIFVDAFLDNRQMSFAEPEAIEAHLVWIVRFYQGTVLYPNGWNRVSERFLASINERKAKKKMAKRIRALGILIANEWSQDNDIRRINSTHVATWGSALRTAAERGDQDGYVTKVESDAQALIDNRLESKEIDYERYYPTEDYDNF